MKGGQRDLTALPKAHLHIHLFGSLRRTTVADFARAAGYDDAAVAGLLDSIATVGGITDFLAMSHRVQDLIRTPEQVDRICREFIEDEAAAGVVHTEPSFVPHDLAARFGMTADELFLRMDGVFRTAARFEGISVAYVISPNRGRDAAYLREAAEFAVRMRDHGVVAFGYGGDEHQGHQRMHEALAIARAGGLRLDPHAGEVLGPESVRTAVVRMGASTIAHGVTAAGDPRVLSMLVRLQIPCNVSIGSNAALHVVPDAAHHPLPAMLAARACVTLNADDTTFFAPSVLAEFETARTVLKLSDTELATLAANSLRVAAMRPAERRRALARVDAWLKRPGAELG